MDPRTKKDGNVEFAIAVDEACIDRLDELINEVVEINKKHFSAKCSAESERRIGEISSDEVPEYRTRLQGRIRETANEKYEREYSNAMPYVSVRLEDGSRQEIPDVAGLKRIPNVTGRRIVEMSFRAGSTECLMMSIDIRNRRVLTHIDYTLYGPDSLVEIFSRRICEAFAMSKQWYSAVTRVPVFNSLLVLFVVLLISIDISKNEVYGYIFSAIVDAVSILIIVVSLVGLLKFHVTPYLVFAVGDGKRRHKYRVWLQYFILVTVAVGVVVSVVAGKAAANL